MDTFLLFCIALGVWFIYIVAVQIKRRIGRLFSAGAVLPAQQIDIDAIITMANRFDAQGLPDGLSEYGKKAYAAALVNIIRSLGVQIDDVLDLSEDARDEGQLNSANAYLADADQLRERLAKARVALEEYVS